MLVPLGHEPLDDVLDASDSSPELEAVPSVASVAGSDVAVEGVDGSVVEVVVVVLEVEVSRDPEDPSVTVVGELVASLAHAKRSRTGKSGRRWAIDDGRGPDAPIHSRPTLVVGERLIAPTDRSRSARDGERRRERRRQRLIERDAVRRQIERKHRPVVRLGQRSG